MNTLAVNTLAVNTLAVNTLAVGILVYEHRSDRETKANQVLRLVKFSAREISRSKVNTGESPPICHERALQDWVPPAMTTKRWV